MKFSDVEKIKEARTPRAANILLAQGWELLSIQPSRHPHHVAVYILGARTLTDVAASVPSLPDAPSQA